MARPLPRPARRDPGRPPAPPHRSPGRTDPEVERRVLEVRDQFGWGPRKIHAYLGARGVALPSARTVGSVLRRHGRTAPPPAEQAAGQRFERGALRDQAGRLA